MGFHDDKKEVRDAVEKACMTIPINSILNAFNDKANQRSTLKITIKEIQDKNIPMSKEFKKFLRSLYLQADRQYDDYSTISLEKDNNL